MSVLYFGHPSSPITTGSDSSQTRPLASAWVLAWWQESGPSQMVWRFSSSSPPPLDLGVMWSTVLQPGVTCPRRRHGWHRPPSRLRIRSRALRQAHPYPRSDALPVLLFQLLSLAIVLCALARRLSAEECSAGMPPRRGTAGVTRHRRPGARCSRGLASMCWLRRGR